MQGVFIYLALCLVTYGFIYYGQWRYRIPMEPFMLLVATPLLMRVWSLRSTLRTDPGAAGTTPPEDVPEASPERRSPA
jgi:hypothetical protein